MWFYTCRFFKIKDNIYVDEDDLKQLMNGAHIAIGYETAAMLCDDMVIQLSELLESGESFFKAYPKALQDGEMLHADSDHIVHFVYVEAAMNETIYTPKYTYEYDISDVFVQDFKGVK